MSRYGYQRDGIDQADYTLSYEYSETWLDQLVSNDIIIGEDSRSQDYVYDAQGNPTSITNFYFDDGDPETSDYYNHAELTWDGRQLAKIQIYDVSGNESSPVWTIQYTYNDQGYRTGKTISEPEETDLVTTYELLGSQVIHESNGTDDIYYTYDSDGTLISFNLNGEDYFCLNNLQGDVVALVDEDGVEVASFEYDSYGNLLSSTGTVKSPLTYRGYRYDWETGWYYIQSRFYDPINARWISSDSFSIIASGEVAQTNGVNLYEYCFNNATMYFDSDGLWPTKVDISPWTYRIDEKNTAKEHIHLILQKKGLDFAQNKNGSAHDQKTKSGNPPRWVTERIRDAGIWNWVRHFSLLPQEKPSISTFPLLNLHEYLEKFPLQRQSNTLETIPMNPPQNSVETFPIIHSSGFWETFPVQDAVPVIMVIVVIVGIIVFVTTGIPPVVFA